MSITKLTSDLPTKGRLFAASLLLTILCRPVGGQQPGPNDRLIAVGKLWVTIGYFHPFLARNDVAWDQALIDSLPAIRSAKDSASYGHALQSMLDRLHDPATFVIRQASPTNPGLHWEQKQSGLIVSEIENGANDDAERAKQKSALAQVIQSSDGIVFDLRMPGNKSSDYLSGLLDTALLPAMAASALDLPGDRAWIHHGLPSDKGLHSDLFYAAFVTKPGAHITGDSAVHPKRFAFLLGEQALLPRAALALWRAGAAAVLAEAPHFRIAGTQQVVIDAGEGVSVNLRLSEPYFADGSSFSEPIPVAADKALDSALTSLARKADPKPIMLSPLPVIRPGNAYADMPFPAPEYRILAASKIWGAFRYFFAYRDLMDEDWDALFAEFLPKILNATDARSYNLAVAEMVTHVDDTQSAVHSATLDEYFGQAPVPFRTALVEKRPIVTEAFQDARNADIHVGDVVLSVDGEDVIARIKREAQFVSASTQQSLRRQVMNVVLNGPEGSTAVLTVRDEEGHSKEVRLKRSVACCAAARDQRSGEPVRLLAGGIGYVDLDRLLPDQVDSMFDTLKSAKAIIFDMRGTPHVSPEALASRLTNKTDVAAAILTGPLALAPDVPGREKLTDTSSFFFVQTFPPSPKPHFTGKTVMLIDERTSGDGEWLGLFLEAANNTAFIGDASAGALTAATDFVVPGGLTITLSGIDVRHGNAGKLQRLGLQPSVLVPSSVISIRSGRDEVLEKALASLSQ